MVRAGLDESTAGLLVAGADIAANIGAGVIARSGRIIDDVAEVAPGRRFSHSEYFLRKEGAYQRYVSRAEAAGRDVMGPRAWKGQFDARYARFRGYLQAKYGPTQVHHLATNKHSYYTQQMEEVAGKYGLGLDQGWNKLRVPHVGSHPFEYHEFVLGEMRAADALARGDLGTFLSQYKIRVTDVVRSDPGMLNASWWR